MKMHEVEKNVKSLFTETNSTISEVNHLPLCIIEEILVKVHIKSVLRCKSVRKSWYNLIRGPNFAQLYAKSSPITWILASRNLDFQSLYLLEIEGAKVDVIRSPLCPEIVSLRETEVLEVMDGCSGMCCRPDRFILKEPEFLQIVASSNGLCCYIRRYRMSDYVHYFERSPNVIICNPVTGEQVELPNGKAHGNQLSFLAVYEICFNPSTGRYKIIRIMEQPRKGDKVFTLCQIFTLGVDKNWRNIEDSSLPESIIDSSVCFNGIVHCLGRKTGPVFIYALNVEEEKGRCFSCPEIRSDLSHRLIVLDDHLCLVSDPNDTQIDLWVMEEYGVAESWTKYIILIEVDQRDKYNLVGGEVSSRVSYVPCFSSLKDIMAGGYDGTSMNPSQTSS